MDNVIVGIADCSLYNVLDTLERNSVWSVVVNGWSQLALQLDTPPLTVSVLRKDLLLEKKSHSEVVLELLTVWKSRNAGNATLGKLVCALRNCGWNEFADSLVSRFVRE